MGSFYLCFVIYIINLSMRAHWMHATELQCLCFTSEVASHSSSFFCFLALYFVCMHRKQSFNLRSRTASIGDTYRTPMAISNRGKQLFKKFCFYRHMRKKLPSFHSCRIYNSLHCNTVQSNYHCRNYIYALYLE